MKRGNFRLEKEGYIQILARLRVIRGITVTANLANYEEKILYQGILIMTYSTIERRLIISLDEKAISRDSLLQILGILEKAKLRLE